MSLCHWKEKNAFFFYRNKIHRNRIIPRKIINEFFSCAFVETAFENEVRFSVFKASMDEQAFEKQCLPVSLFNNGFQISISLRIRCIWWICIALTMFCPILCKVWSSCGVEKCPLFSPATSSPAEVGFVLLRYSAMPDLK